MVPRCYPLQCAETPFSSAAHHTAGGDWLRISSGVNKSTNAWLHLSPTLARTGRYYLSAGTAAGPGYNVVSVCESAASDPPVLLQMAS